MMNTQKTCQITRCDAVPRWNVTIEGHPNVKGLWSYDYCTEHAQERAGSLWDESPAEYTVTVRGPFGGAR